MKNHLPKLFIAIIFACTILLSFALSAQTQNPSQYKVSSEGFFENKGQIDDQNYAPNPAVKYLFSSPGFNVQLRQTGFSYDTYTATPCDTTTQKETVTPKGKKHLQAFTFNYHRVDIELLGCNTNAQITTEGKSVACYNYITAGAPQAGVSNVHNYAKVVYKDIYPHIDLEFMSKTSANAGAVPVEYQFVVHPGGNPGNIKLAYKGANNINLNNGKLVVNVNAGDFTESIPSSYLKANGQAVKVSYAALGNNVFTFYLPNTMALTSDLVIDPVPNLVWGTYYGGSGDDEAYGIAVDATDNIYITGYTNSTSHIATTGEYQSSNGGGYDAFVAKFDPSGKSLIWGTYYGGSGTELGYGIALDASDNVYITGCTTSTSAIATPGAYQTNYAGGTYDGDAFVAKFDSSGKSLLWGTYFGGSADEYGDGIVLDANDDIYITGETESSSGIATTGAYQTAYGGDGDAFVAEFNPSLIGSAQLVWATYYGGSGNEYGYGIKIDNSRNIYITGGTTSTSAIATAGAYNTTCGAHGNAFIAMFNLALSGSAQLEWGTYYGGQGSSQGGDFAYAIALDAKNNIYITGQAGSTTGIATPDAYDTSYGVQGVSTFWEAFIGEFNPGLSGSAQLVWGTYYGASSCSTGGPPLIPPQFDGYAIAVDACSNIYITGELEEGQCAVTGMVTPDAYQTTIGSEEYCYVAKFNPTLSAPAQLVWGTYYGGTGLNYNDQAWGIALDTSNNVFITGLTQSSNGIATLGEYQTTFGGSKDVFVAMFDSSGPCSSCLLPNAAGTITSGSSIYICTAGKTGGYTYSVPAITYATGYTWSLPTGATITAGTNTDSITVSYAGVSVSGQQSITVYGTDTCGNGATSVLTVYINPVLPIVIQPQSPSVCATDDTISLSVPVSGSGYTWTPSSTLNSSTGDNVVATPLVTTTYTVTGTDSLGCSAFDTVIVTVNPNTTLSLVSPSPICNGDSVTLIASLIYISGTTYIWTPTTGLSATTGDTVIAHPSVTTTYTVTETNTNGCSATGSDTVSINQVPNKPTITRADNVLTSTASEGNQWYRNGAELTGATNKTYDVTSTGCYWTVATNPANGCSSISDTICVDTVTGINSLSINPGQLSVYPNPTGGEIFININPSVANVNDCNLLITDLLGRTVYTKLSLNYSNDIDISALPPAMYFITVTNNTGRTVMPIVKVN